MPSGLFQTRGAFVNKFVRRRDAVKLIGAGGIAGLSLFPFLAQGTLADDSQIGTGTLQAAFEKLRGSLASGNLVEFFGLIDDRAVIYDEDIPFRLSKADFKDHIDFHLRDIWESFAWLPRELKYSVYGVTGAVMGYAIFRGKPRDAGFRQVQMAFTQGWYMNNGVWMLFNWHQSPLSGHVLENSPG